MSVPQMNFPSQFDLSQEQGERYGGGRDEHQRPKHIYIGEQCCLRLDLLANPGDGLLPGLPYRAALGGKIVHQLLHRLLIRDA